MVNWATGEVESPEQEQGFDIMTDMDKWDKLGRLREIRGLVSEQITLLEQEWIRELKDDGATTRNVRGRGLVSLDWGSPVYNKDNIRELYSLLGEDVCDAGTRKLISRRVTETEKVDGVRVRQLLKHGESVRKIVDDAQSNAVQKPARIKLIGEEYGRRENNEPSQPRTDG